MVAPVEVGAAEEAVRAPVTVVGGVAPVEPVGGGVPVVAGGGAPEVGCEVCSRGVSEDELTVVRGGGAVGVSSYCGRGLEAGGRVVVRGEEVV